MRLGGRLAMVSAALMVWAAGAPVLAGDEVLYRPAPDWVVPLDLPAERAGAPIVLFDDQRRIEEGRLTSFADRAIRIDNPQMLTAAGTIVAPWLPDKGDLIVHRVAILRGREEIDVLAGGAKFEVLRREQGLEQRSLDGMTTATLAVPGLRVGDVLRVSFTTTLSDQALDREVQAIAVLPTEPFQAQRARVRLSWPEASAVRWQATGGVQLPEPEVAAGFATIEVALPLAKRPDMPEDAPLRYRMPPLLQAGTFADWPEVSRVMAPHYATAGVIAAGSPLAAQVAAIQAAETDPLARAVAALRLVQDEVAYLANGMNGGNYIPQAPAQTWEMRYGDCKAKTLLLLAMLREMGVEAEAVAVASQTGDGVPDLLPMPAAFDHVIVRATIAGTEYWLDGTSSGASMAIVAGVPSFHHALPLREDGAGLVAMAQRPQDYFDNEAVVTFDHRAGLDLPMLVTGEWQLTGPHAAMVRSIIGQGSPEQLDEFAQAFVNESLGEAQVITHDLAYDAATNRATVTATGLMTTPWEWERRRGKRAFALPSSAFQFLPDRARPAWRDIPVALSGPYAGKSRITVLLPAGSDGYSLQGPASFAEEIAGIAISRAAELDGDRLVITDSAVWPGGEMAAEQATAERSRAVRFGTPELTLRAPAGVQRRFAMAGAADRSRLAAIEAAYQTMIDDDPDDMEGYANRARFREGTFDREGALADVSRVLEVEPDADTYLWRSGLHADLDRMDAALADAEAAWALSPSVQAAGQRAELLRYMGRTDEAIALLEDQPATGDEKIGLEIRLSDLEAQAGRKEDGLARITELLAQRPGQPSLLNARCWYQATWDYQPEELATICTEAVESADWSPPVLDSRAMGYFRLGRYDDALRDLNAALTASPDLASSLFMRGVVRQAKGEEGGAQDIREALARSPSTKRYYALFGISPE
ncbi:DUF3857 domain-containing transglutaminase family protein [Croceibacterium ferulae]|uniref:DUF3857 domain-containing transglutaminase family protein n=1 Tax=Croceibacterium ferulae TaxID=1854641 RepID=UPI000EAC8FD0|nr:DUF3857 domain-containing transglutaminase family protein [Croceibacterium ferulae]